MDAVMLRPYSNFSFFLFPFALKTAYGRVTKYLDIGKFDSTRSRRCDYVQGNL